MKKINFLMALMMAFTLSFVACEQPEEPKKPEPAPTPAAPFVVTIGEVTASSIAYTVTPADLEAEYLCVLYDAETVEEFTRDQFLVENLFMELTEEARTSGKTLTEYMPEVADKGVISDGLFSDLAPESDYYIIVFGVKLNAENEYECYTDVVKTEVTTADRFVVTIGEVTSSSIAYTVTPADLEAEYLCVLYDAETVEEFTRDQFLVENLFMELTEEARTSGKTLTEYMPEVADKGVISDGLFGGLAPESDYYIIVFGVELNDENKYVCYTDVVKIKITTLAGPTLDVTFEIDTTVDGNTATYTVTPSNNEDVWYFYTLPKATFDAYTDPEGGYRMTDQSFLLYCMQMEIDAYRQAGYSDNQIMNSIFHKGKLTLEAKNLNAKSEYINMVAGFIVTPEGVVTIATELTTSTYTTGEAKAAELSFEISVTDIEAMRAAILITPSNNKDTFCWMVGAWDGVKSAEDIMNETVAMYGGWMNNGAMLYKGVQDFTGGPNSAYKYKLDAAGTKYYVVAFGYAGGITTEPKMVTFETLPAPSAEDTTFQMSASQPSPYGFTVGVTPSESTTYYTFNVMPNSEFEALDVEALAEELNAQFDEIMMMQQQFDPTITIAQVLSMYYYRGAYTASAAGLAPETTCSGFVMALSPETGHVVKVHTFKDVATTTPLGVVAPTVELIGNWSGDDENGAIFGQPAATKGKAITVVKYGNFNGARTLFGSMAGDDVTNSFAYPDAELWGQLSGTWSKIDQSQPYSFYVVEWDAPQTAFAYAIDNNGRPGALGRCYTNATVENKGNIDDLKALVEELDAASKSSFSLPKSLVVEEQSIHIINAKPVNAQVVEAAEVDSPVFEAPKAKELCFPIVRF